MSTFESNSKVRYVNELPTMTQKCENRRTNGSSPGITATVKKLWKSVAVVNEYDCTFLKLIDTVNGRMLPGTIGFASEQRHGDNWKTMRQVIYANLLAFVLTLAYALFISRFLCMYIWFFYLQKALKNDDSWSTLCQI